MEKKFFIFIGRSGSGKGTQAALLKKYIEEKNGKALSVATGEGFRHFIEGNSYTALLAREVNNRGKLQPEFLAVWAWANLFIEKIEGNETIIIDGAPRKPFEVEVLHSAVTFFGYIKPIVIYLDVSEGVSRKQLSLRGREDDKNEEDVSNRMNWFETDVLPTFEVYLHDPRYTVLHINGEQTIEDVHRDIISKIG